MASDVLAGQDCPRCRARQRPGAPWCTQCYLDLRPEVTPPKLPRPAGPRAKARPSRRVVDAGDGTARDRRAEPPRDRRGDPADGPPVASWPCTRCGVPNPLIADVCAGCGQGFLAAVRESTPPLLVLPLLGDVAALRPAQRLCLAGAVIAMVALLTLLLGVLL